MNLQHRDRITVRKDGEEIEVFNWVTVYQNHLVRPTGHESQSTIFAGDGSTREEPEAVTDELAEWIWDEFLIDVEDHDIDVIDPEAEEVEVV